MKEEFEEWRMNKENWNNDGKKEEKVEMGKDQWRIKKYTEEQEKERKKNNIVITGLKNRKEKWRNG